MTIHTATSSLDILGWFCNRAAQGRQKLSSKQVQNILFLTQMHYLNKYGRVLMPTMFVCYHHGFYNPTIDVILSHGLPLLPQPQLTEQIVVLLESIWQKYSALSEQQLCDFITSLNCWQNYFTPDQENIVNPYDQTAEFTSAISGNKLSSATKSKIRLSQNGPVQVSPWQPRKIKTSSNNKKEN